MATKTATRKKAAASSRAAIALETHLIADDNHPDFVGGSVSAPDDDLYAEQARSVPGGFPIPGPLPGPLPRPLPTPGPTPLPGPIPLPDPFPRVPLPLNLCSAVSGRYVFRPRLLTPLPGPAPQPSPSPVGPQPALPARPLLPLALLTMTVRVDVDRYYPQHRISIEVSRLVPRSTAHAIAEVTSDRCVGFNNRRIEAQITYRDGDSTLIQGDRVEFTASRTAGIGYGQYQLALIGSGGARRTYDLSFVSPYFDPVEFEVDCVSNAGTPVTTHDIGAHPNRPADLPVETISLQTVYQRAGFDVAMSPGGGVIPTSGAGANGTWSDAEMHNAMVAFWSRFADRPQWAMWVLYAARHDQGRSLGGIMFDDIGANHRQGTAIFTDSFIQDAPAGDANAAAWRRRMVFWTAVHEMGHAFNLAHAWQKALGTPWIPLANAPEARSFMNYPFRVSGGQGAFFADFRFRFTDDELVFMRHAPRRFVQMGNEDWFSHHGFEDSDALTGPRAFQLRLRPNREVNAYRFLEPVNLELKLTNTSSERVEVDDDLLKDGRHIAVIVRRDGGETRKWRPFATYCHEPHNTALKPGESLYGAHMISASTDGWLIDEPGFYTVQAMVLAAGELVVSNVLRIFVGTPADGEETAVAPDYFAEDVGRTLAFAGAPSLERANDTLREVEARCAANPAARHAAVALSNPLLRHFKLLQAKDRDELEIVAAAERIDAGAKQQKEALIKQPEAAAQTLGHIAYFGQLNALAEAMSDAGDGKGASQVLESAVSTMKKRKVLDSVVKATERKLAQTK
ncbi:MAG: hypothetical protein R3F55_07070 [Alphaproteobacteria bacterium]